jgi:hypothetical protein
MAQRQSVSILHPRSSILVLLVLSLVLIVARLRSYYEPPEWDIGTYQSIARELLNGKRLYADAWDVKPPAIFATFAATQFFTGDGALPVYLLSVSASIITMLGIYRAASTASTPVQSEGRNDRSAGPARTAIDVTAGICAALFWVAMCYAPWTGGNLPNTEVFINASLAWALALWLRAPLPEQSWKHCALLALLFAIASLYKQVALIIFVCLALADFVSTARARRASHVRKLIAIAAMIALIWCTVLGYFAITARGWLAWQTLFVAPRAYSGGMMHNLTTSLSPQRIISAPVLFALPAAALTVVALVAAPRRRRRMLGGTLIGAHLAVALPGQFFPHYYQLWFVPLSIGAGWGAAALLQLMPRKSLAYAVIALALIAMIVPQASWYTLSGRQWARRKYGDFFIDAQDGFLAATAQLGPNDTLYTWSDEAYAYAITHRRPPATALWKMHTTTGPLADWLTQRTLADLQKNPPAMIILYGDQPGPAGHPILEWTLANYDLMPDPRRKFFPLTVYVRKRVD